MEFYREIRSQVIVRLNEIKTKWVTYQMIDSNDPNIKSVNMV